MTYYARHLPHWQPLGRSIFLTWRLFGSLPQEVIAELNRNQNLSEGKTFLMADRELDNLRTGPRWLNEASIARCVIAALYSGEHELHQYVLHAFAIMPNHVHVLIEPSVSLARITNGLKGATARQGQSVTRANGQTFLARRIVRPLDTKWRRIRSSQKVYRTEPRRRRAGQECRGLAVVERLK
jgi:putative transposase